MSVSNNCLTNYRETREKFILYPSFYGCRVNFTRTVDRTAPGQRGQVWDDTGTRGVGVYPRSVKVLNTWFLLVLGTSSKRKSQGTRKLSLLISGPFVHKYEVKS